MKKSILLIMVFSTLLGCFPSLYMPKKEQPPPERIQEFIREFSGKKGKVILTIPSPYYKIPAGTEVTITNITFNETYAWFDVEVTDHLGRQDTYHPMYSPTYNLQPFDDQLRNFISFGDAKSEQAQNELDSLRNQVYWVLPEISSIESKFSIKPDQKVKIITVNPDLSEIDITKGPPSYINNFVVVENIDTGKRDSLNFRMHADPNYNGMKQWQDFIEPRLSPLSPEERRVRSLERIKSFVALPTDIAIISGDPVSRTKLIALQTKYHDKLVLFASVNYLIPGGELKTWATLDLDTATVKMVFVRFKEKIYLQVPYGIYSVVFNDLRTDEYVRARIVFNELVAKALRRLDASFGDSKDFDGYLFRIKYAHYNFLKEIEGEVVTQAYMKGELPNAINQDKALFYVTIQECRNLSQFDITSQDLIDRSIVIVNENRIKLSLEGGLLR